MDDEEFDLFDEEEADGDRFQFGMNIGLRCMYNNFNFGVGYGFDFNEIMEKTKLSSWNFSVGFSF